MFKGSFPALITPFRDGAIDEDALRQIIATHRKEGSHGLVPAGTTGESPTLSHEEHCRLIALVVEEAAGALPVIAGTGSNSTEEAILFTRHAKEVGADAALIVTPYYNKPTQEGLFTHFQSIHDAVPDLPILIYNIPGRSVVDMSVETMARLSKLPHIVGVKDATCDMARVSLQRQECGEDFCQLSGEDASTLGFMAHGGRGCISVTANVAPRLCAELQNACLKGDFAAALQIQDKLMPLHHALFAESSPAPVKYAASLLGLCRQDVRAPLVPVQEKTERLVRQALQHAGIKPNG